jgi:signal transduction histidine kinase
LDGFETQWHSASTGVVNYSKLAPGTYVFHVTCINHAGLKPRADDYLTLVINPPFWKTTWFILSSSIVLILLILAIARYIFTRNLREKILILEKEKALEKERNRISQDMHDELGSGLTKISILSEVAMAQLEAPEKTIDQLKNISNSSRALVDTLQDIIWILNSKNETLDNLCAYIREYTFKYFEASDIKIKVHFPEKIEARALLDDQRRSILMVFKEAFHNITKHSHCTQIEMRLEITAHYAKFILIDNGIGFDQANVRQFANGLNNMKKRMSSIGGDFAISSKLKEGARTEFGFPL